MPTLPTHPVSKPTYIFQTCYLLFWDEISHCVVHFSNTVRVTQFNMYIAVKSLPVAGDLFLLYVVLGFVNEVRIGVRDVVTYIYVDKVTR